MRDSGNSPVRTRLSCTSRRAIAYFTVGAYAVAAPFGCVGVSVLDLLWRRDAAERARRMQRLTSGAYRFMHDWLNFTRIADFDYRTTLRDVPQGPCVVVANHPTLMDITAISAALGRGFTVVKPKLHARRVLRPFMVGAGHVAGASSDPASTGRVVDEAVERVTTGFPLIVFPEGTRSPPGGLRPFGRTAFEIACRARVPVVSVTIECDPLFLSKEVSLFHTPDVTPRLSLRLLAVDDPADHGHESRSVLQHVEGRYRRWHAESRLAGIPSPR